MSDPKRLRDEPGDAAELLRAARQPRPLPDDVRARSAARVAALAATPIAVGAAAKWWSGKTLAFWLGFGVIGAAIGIGAYALRGGSGGVVVEPQTANANANANANASANASANANANANASANASATASASASAGIVAIAKPHASAKPSASIDTLAEEHALLDPVRGKLESDPGAVLAAVDAHKSKYPGGQLAADREYLAIRALKKLGREGDARARGEAFLAKYATSPYASYVRKLIE